MKVLLKKEVCGFNEQCTESIGKTKKCKFTFSTKKKKAKTQMLVFFNCTQMDTKSIKQTKITIEIDSSYEKKSWNYNNKNKNRLTK